jgi:hypothetical protein
MRAIKSCILAAAFAGVVAMLAPGAPAIAAGPDRGIVLQAAPAGGVQLGAGPVQVRLLRPDGAPATRDDLPARGPLYLVVQDLSASAPPGAIFRLYLGLRPGEAPRPGDSRYVGSLSFYDAVRSASGGWTATSVSLEVTRLLARHGPSSTLEPTVTIVPSRPPRPGSDPRIGGLLIAAG